MIKKDRLVRPPHFVFALFLVVAALAVCYAVSALSDKPKQQAPHGREWTPADSVLARQVDEIFVRVRNIESLVIKNSGRIQKLEKTENQ